MKIEHQDLVKETFKNILEPELINLLVENGEIVHAKEGKEIIKPGKYIQSFQFVLKGTIKISRPAEDGSDLFMYYLTDKEACAMSITCCMTSRKSEITAFVEEDSVLLQVPLHFTDKWIVEFAGWKRLIFNTYQQRFNDLLQTIDSIAFLKMDERLLELIERKKKVFGSNIINDTHEDIAIELNTSREVVSRLLKQLEKMGRVKLGRNKIELL